MYKEGDVILKAFARENLEQTFSWIQNKEFRRVFGVRGEPDWETHVNYFNKILNDSTQKVFAIYCAHRQTDRQNRHAGNCGFKYIFQNTAELWIYIGNEQERHLGIGTQACKQLIERGFNEFGFEKIFLHVSKDNIPAQGLYKKLGFIETQENDFDREIWGEKICQLIKMVKRR